MVVAIMPVLVGMLYATSATTPVATLSDAKIARPTFLETRSWCS